MKHVLLIAGLALINTLAAHSQDRGFGLGLILGEPTGVSAKVWTSGNNAVDAGLAWSFRGKGFFHLHADYLWHFPGAIRSTERFIPYAGVGGRFGAAKKDGILGVRIVGGLAFWPRGVPLDVFVEFAPVLDLIPATEMRVNGGIGARFYFD